MHYSIIIQGSPINGAFQWINHYKFNNPFITAMTILFKPTQGGAMFNNVDSTNVVTNTNGEEVTISPGYYTLSEIIAILNTMTNTTFSISTMATSYGCIWIQSAYSIDFSDAPDIREIFGLGGQMIVRPASFYGSNVIDITRNRQVIQVYSSLVRSSDLKIANQNNNLLTTMMIDDPEVNYCRSVEEICIPMIHRFDRLMFLFKDMDGNMMNLVGEFELQLTIEDVIEQMNTSFTSTNQFSMIEVFGNNSKKEVKLDNPLSFNQCYVSSVSLYTDFVLHNVPTDQVVVINGGYANSTEITIPQGAYEIETIIAMLNASDALFELVYSGENAFRVTVNNFYTIDFSDAREIQSILGFDSSVLEKGVDNPKRYYLSTTCNQIAVTNGTVTHVLSIPTGYYTYLEFIEAVGVELGKVVTLVSMTIEDEYVMFNVTGDGWYFDRGSANTTIDKFGWTPWFKLSPSTHNMCIERPDSGSTDVSDDNTDGYAYLDSAYLLCSYLYRNSFGFRYLAHPTLSYEMSNADDGSLFDEGTIYLDNGLYKVNTLLSTCLDELNDRYAEIRNIPPSHQEGIAWVQNDTEDNCYSTWVRNGDYAPLLTMQLSADNVNGSLISTNTDRSGGQCGPWESIDCDDPDNVYLTQDIHYTLLIEGVSSSHTISSGEYTLSALCDVFLESINSNTPGIVSTLDQGYQIVISSTKSITSTCDDPFFTIPNGSWTTFNFRRTRFSSIRLPTLTQPSEMFDYFKKVVEYSFMSNKTSITDGIGEDTFDFDRPFGIYFADSDGTKIDPLFNVNGPNGFIYFNNDGEYRTTQTIRYPFKRYEYDNVEYGEGDASVELNTSGYLTQSEFIDKMNEELTNNNIDVQWTPGADGYTINADHVFTLSGNMGTTIPVSGSYSHTWKMPYIDGAYYANYGPMVAEYPVDITNGLSNIRLYCNIVKSKTNPLLVNIPMDSLYKNYFYKNRMLIPCSELLDRIEYELKDENDESLSFIGNVYLLIGFTVIAK